MRSSNRRLHFSMHSISIAKPILTIFPNGWISIRPNTMMIFYLIYPIVCATKSYVISNSMYPRTWQLRNLIKLRVNWLKFIVNFDFLVNLVLVLYCVKNVVFICFRWDVRLLTSRGREYVVGGATECLGCGMQLLTSKCFI